VDDILCGVAASSDRDSVIDDISSKVTFIRSKELTTLFYVTYIEQCTQYIRVHAGSYISSCLVKLDLEADSTDTSLMVPLTPALLKTLLVSPGPLNPTAVLALANKFGFAYCTLTGMLIFSVQISRFDIAPAVSILCKFNEHPSDVHFLAARNVMRYLRATRARRLVYWRPSGRERPDLPRGDLIPMRPKCSIAFPTDLPLMDPECYVDAYYGGLLPIGEHHSITGIIICLGTTAIFAKTRIQRTTALSSTEAKIIAGCDAGEDIKYFRTLFGDLQFPITQPTLVAEDNAGTILVANHRRPSGRTHHLDIQYFATQEWVQCGIMRFYKTDGTANPSDAMSRSCIGSCTITISTASWDITVPPIRHIHLSASIPTTTPLQSDCHFIFHATYYSPLSYKSSIFLFFQC
jgi:hypothetical protein